MEKTLTGITLKNQYYLRELMDESGGMADLYLAWDQDRAAKMAVKVLRQDLVMDDHFVRLFEQEAKLLSELTHPHIVRLYEFKRDGEIMYIVMDWIDGSNLRRVIRGRPKPFSLHEVSTILEPICSALDFAHKNQVYHCDVKPANILIHADGKVYLTDFGIARLAAERRRAEGTPPYMAPEQFDGRDVDARTDVYALGVTLFELLSGGRLPFRGDNPSSKGTTQRQRIAWEHQYLPMPPLSQINSRVPKPIEEVLQTALQKEPSNRYSSVMDLRTDFNAASTNAPEEKTGGQGFDEKNLMETIISRVSSAPEKTARPPKIPFSRPPSPAVVAHPKGMHLFGRAGSMAGLAIRIPTGELTIGRGSQNQVQIQDRSVSRMHASITRTRRGVYLRDQDSSVGTYVNGRRIYNRPIQLQSGDVIRIGHYLEFEFRKR